MSSSTSNSAEPCGGSEHAFFERSERALSDQFLRDGFVIVESKRTNLVHKIQSRIAELCATGQKSEPGNDTGTILNEAHRAISASELNQTRLNIFRRINQEPWFRPAYYDLAREALHTLVGNELVMQRNVNLSIQFPQDSSSLLPVHSDVWSGDSPFEVVVWLPLVNCTRTKSMFILPREQTLEVTRGFARYANATAEDLFKDIEASLVWLDVDVGQFVLFSHTLLHGNVTNEEDTTRWSMNCRFKSVFSPYSTKRLGEFFEPVTLRAATRIGMEYELPKLSRDEA